jgi:hypothetical protein
MAIVEHQPISIKPRRYNGMILFPGVVPQYYDPKVNG